MSSIDTHTIKLHFSTYDFSGFLSLLIKVSYQLCIHCYHTAGSCDSPNAWNHSKHAFRVMILDSPHLQKKGKMYPLSSTYPVWNPIMSLAVFSGCLTPPLRPALLPCLWAAAQPEGALKSIQGAAYLSIRYVYWQLGRVRLVGSDCLIATVHEYCILPRFWN